MSDVEMSEMLGESVLRALAECASARHTVLCEKDGIDRTAWRTLIDLGLTSQDSAQLELRELEPVLRGIGYSGVLVPYAESECLGRWVANAAAFETESNEILSVLVAGSANIEFDRQNCVAWVSLTGQHVKWGRHADRVMVVFQDGDRHFASGVPASGFDFSPASNLAAEPYDQCMAGKIQLPVVRSIPANFGVQAIRSRGAFCRIAEMCGAARRINELTLQYASDRRQFGRPIGQYQVIQSYLAEMAAEECAATAMLEVVLDALSRDGTADCLELAAARVRMGPAAQRICTLAHQIHGAIGFTREYPLHLWTRRLWAWREEYGNETEWARTLGQTMIGLGPSSYWERITNSAGSHA